MVIGIDFDGTIVDDAFPEIGKVKPLAKETIGALIEKGHEVVIWTCRDYGVIKDFLDGQGWGFRDALYINENPPTLKNKYRNDPRKLGVDMFIDDKNLFTRVVDWHNIVDELKFLGVL